ncbi:hypothetical protein G9A89_014172 [Geosiphon pyriformis]|nr:hypothetical protein G9A89_014172 [Geosiphon pyriformis]
MAETIRTPIYEDLAANDLEQNLIPVDYSFESDAGLLKELDTKNAPLIPYDNQLRFKAVITTPSLVNQLNQEFSNTLQPQTVSENVFPMPSSMASLVDEGRESQVSTQPEDSSTFTVENGNNELNLVSFSQDSLPNIPENSPTKNEMRLVAFNLGEGYNNFKKDRDLLKNDSKEVQDLRSYALMAKAISCNFEGQIMYFEQIPDTEIAVTFFSEKKPYDNLVTDYKVDQISYPNPPNEVEFLKSIGKEKGLMVHSGFYQRWLTLQEEFLQRMAKLTFSHNNAVVRFIGHGVGGVYAVFASLSYLARYPKKDIAVYTYGQPRMGNENFRALIEKIINHQKGTFQIFRVTRSDDPVVHWPMNDESDPGVEDIIILAGGIVKQNAFVHHQTEYFFEEETNHVYRCKKPWFKKENKSCANGKELNSQVNKHNGPYFNATMEQCIP